MPIIVNLPSNIAMLEALVDQTKTLVRSGKDISSAKIVEAFLILYTPTNPETVVPPLALTSPKPPKVTKTHIGIAPILKAMQEFPKGGVFSAQDVAKKVRKTGIKPLPKNLRQVVTRRMGQLIQKGDVVQLTGITNHRSPCYMFATPVGTKNGEIPLDKVG